MGKVEADLASSRFKNVMEIPKTVSIGHITCRLLARASYSLAETLHAYSTHVSMLPCTYYLRIKFYLAAMMSYT